MNMIQKMFMLFAIRFTCFGKMPDSYTFSGDAVTFLGLVGILSTGIIILTAFRRYFNSPLRK